MSELVSVIIPTHNRPVEYLKNAVDSVLEQTYKNIEIIIVDDSFSDYEDREEVKNYILSNDAGRFVYIRNEKNLGGSLSRNRGIEAAGGDYITFLDDDDRYRSGKVEKQLAFMKETGCDLSFSNMIMYNQKGEVVNYRDYKNIKSFEQEALLKYHLLHQITGTPTFMFRADKLREIGGFVDAVSAQEYLLMLKSIESGLKIRYFDECDVIVNRDTSGSITYGKSKIYGEQRLYEIKKKYFPILSRSEIRYLNYRYHAVMAIAYKRNDMVPELLKEGIKAVALSPVSAVKEILNARKKINTAKKMSRSA